MQTVISRHAAHYAYTKNAGHDLEVSTFASPKNERHPALHPDAVYQCGFVRGGVQHWVYVRRLPLSPGTCRLCE